MTGAPYDDTRRQVDRYRDDTAFARDLIYELGVDPAKIQRVFRFRKREDNDRSPLMKVTFMTTAARDEALLTRDHRDVLYWGRYSK